MPIYTALKESLSGGNPGEPNACTGAEERGISGATGAGQLPDDKAELEALCESLQNRWASRPLSSEDAEKRIAELEKALQALQSISSDAKAA